jgi:hypothetical protein
MGIGTTNARGGGKRPLANCMSVSNYHPSISPQRSRCGIASEFWRTGYVHMKCPHTISAGGGEQVA